MIGKIIGTLFSIIAFSTGASLVIVGSLIISSYCNSEFKDCHAQMTKVTLIAIDPYQCGLNCYYPEYRFAYVEGVGQCSIIDSSQQFDHYVNQYTLDQVYYMYPYDHNGKIMCDPNVGRENKDSNKGIIMVSVGAFLVLISIPVLIYLARTALKN